MLIMPAIFDSIYGEIKATQLVQRIRSRFYMDYYFYFAFLIQDIADYYQQK
jgi:hypothetical protein